MVAGCEPVGPMASVIKKQGEVNIGTEPASFPRKGTPFPWNGTARIYGGPSPVN